MKRLVSQSVQFLVLALCLAVSSGAMANNEQVEALSLKQAIELAMNNNPSIRLAEIDSETADLNLQEVKINSLTKPSPTALYQAETNAVVAAKNLTLAKHDLTIQVEEDYYGVLKAQNLLTINEEAYKLAEEHLKLTKDKLNSGLVAEIDVIRASSRVASAHANLIKSQGSLELAMSKLRQTLAVDALTPLSLSEELTHESVDFGLQEAIETALKNRVEIAQAESTVALKEKDVELADNEFTPKLTLQKTKLALEEARLKLTQQQAKIELEIRQSYLTMKEAESRLEVLESAVKEATESLRIMQLRYDADMATNLEVLDEQANVAKAKTDYINALFDYRSAKARFFRSLGLEGDQ